LTFQQAKLICFSFNFNFNVVIKSIHEISFFTQLTQRENHLTTSKPCKRFSPLLDLQKITLYIQYFNFFYYTVMRKYLELHGLALWRSFKHINSIQFSFLCWNKLLLPESFSLDSFVRGIAFLLRITRSQYSAVNSSAHECTYIQQCSASIESGRLCVNLGEQT